MNKFTTINNMLEYYSNHDLPTAPVKLAKPYHSY